MKRSDYIFTFGLPLLVTGVAFVVSLAAVEFMRGLNGAMIAGKQLSDPTYDIEAHKVPEIIYTLFPFVMSGIFFILTSSALFFGSRKSRE